MRRGPASGADAVDREPEGITVFEHDMNMRGIDPGAGRDACDISPRAKCLGDDVRRALVRTAPGVLAFVDMRLDQFGKARGHRRKARPRGARVATLGRAEVAQDGRKSIVDQVQEMRSPLGKIGRATVLTTVTNAHTV